MSARETSLKIALGFKSIGQESTKKWFENYLKGVTPYYG